MKEILNELKKKIHKLDLSYMQQADIMECIDEVVDNTIKNCCKERITNSFLENTNS